MNDEKDTLSAKDRHLIVAVLAVLMTPVIAVISWLVWANADAMKPIDWIFIAVVPVTFVATFIVGKLASAEYWNHFRSGFIADIRNRQLIGEVSVFCILMSLVAFSGKKATAEGWPEFLRVLGFNTFGAFLIITLFALGEAWWKKRSKRDG